MNRRVMVLAAAALLLGFSPGPPPESVSGIWYGAAFAAQKTPAQLEADFEQATNPKKRLSLAVELMQERLKEMLAAFDALDPQQQAESIENYMAAADRLETAMDENSNLGAVKKAEIRLRRQTKSLTDLRMTLSAAQQPPVDEVLTRVNHLHEQLLYSIMRPRK